MLGNDESGEGDVIDHDDNAVEMPAGERWATVDRPVVGRATGIINARAMAEFALTAGGDVPTWTVETHAGRPGPLPGDDPSCETIMPLLVEMIFDRLGQDQRRSVIEHVRTCNNCHDWSVRLNDALYSVGDDSTDDAAGRTNAG